MATQDSLEPLTPELVIWLTDLYDKREWTNQDQKLANLISSCFCIANKENIISKIKSEFLSRNTQYLTRNPALLNRFHENIEPNANTTKYSQQINYQLKKDSETANYFFNRTRSITDFIKSNPKIRSIAIVGNGPNLLEAENGEIIDSADLVIRFNNVVINEKNIKSTGRKTDIWMINPGYKIDKSSNIPSKFVWLSSYFPFFRPNSYWHNINNCSFQQHLYSEHNYWYALVKRLNAPPSAGLLCVSNLACTVHDIHVFGFSGLVRANNNYTTDRFSDRYSDTSSGNHYGDKHRKSDRHNWNMESILLHELRNRVIFY